MTTRPSPSEQSCNGAGDDEKRSVYPEFTSWVSLGRSDLEARYPYMPDRIMDNLCAPKAKVSVTDWSRVMTDPGTLSFLIEATFADRVLCEYDLSRPMRRANS